MKTELNSNVREFLAKPLPNLIGGQACVTATEQVLNPSDGSPLAQVAMAGEKEVHLASHGGSQGISRLGRPWLPRDRAQLLHRFADALEKHSAELAQLESLDVGKPITAAEGFDIPFGIECLRYFADLSTRAHYSVPLNLKGFEARTWRVPFGVCGFIFPWNFPFTLLCWGIAPALAAGNTAVVKPSEVTPLTTCTRLGLPWRRACRPACSTSLPALAQEAGVALSSRPRIKRISFTGSPEVGRKSQN